MSDIETSLQGSWDEKLKSCAGRATDNALQVDQAVKVGLDACQLLTAMHDNK